MINIYRNIKHYSSVYTKSLTMSIQRQMEYPSFLLGWFICNPLQFISGILVLYITVQNFGDIAGWSFNELAFLYGISAVSHGLAICLFIQTWYIGGYVINGMMDRFMLRPMNVYFQFSIDMFNLIGFTDLIPGMVILIYGCILVNIKFNIITVLVMLSMILSATMIRGAIYLIAGSVSLYSKSRSQLISITHSLLGNATRVPISIFPQWMQMIFTFILPIGFISFYPASSLLDRKDNVLNFEPMWALCLLVAIALLYIGYKVFMTGLKRYESSGT